jgi:hypothetical protein
MNDRTRAEQHAEPREPRRKAPMHGLPRAQTSKLAKRFAHVRTVGPEERRAMIEEAAYYRAERRGFEPGYELDDWLHAERDIERVLAPSAEEDPRRCGD